MFRSILLSRFLIIAILIAVLFVIVLIQAALNGITIPISPDLAVYYLVSLLLSIFFFLLVSALGKIKPRAFGITLNIICWLLFLFVIPAVVNGYTEIKSADIEPQYKLALKKLKIFGDFEKQAIIKEGINKNDKVITGSIIKMIQGYKNKELKDILANEEAMHGDMYRTALNYHKLSLFFPSTYYISVTEELSSMGYLSLLEFYRHVIGLKAFFVLFILNKLYFENFSKVVPFLQGEQIVYYARSRLPGTFFPGLVLTLVYLAGLVWLNYFLYRKDLYESCSNSSEDIEYPEIRLSYGKHRIFKVSGKMLLKRLYNLFSGGKRRVEKTVVPGMYPQIYVENEDLTRVKLYLSFLYICSPANLPGELAVGNFFNFLCDVTGCPVDKRKELADRLNLDRLYKKKIRQLKNREISALLLAMVQMTSRQVYLFHDIVCGLGRSFTEEFKELLDRLTAKGCLVVYLTVDTTLTSYQDDEFNGFQEKTDDWNRHVDHYREP